jgi:GTP-binding protein Era
MATKSGFVTILGRPNAGKSTLLNALLGTKLAIVADKPQTTRTTIQGVLTLPEAQIIFVDTPGIHKSDTLLNRRMMQAVREALEGKDLILYLADASQPFRAEDREAVGVLKNVHTPALLVPTKVDLLKKAEDVLPLIAQYREIHEFDDYLPVSALTGAGLDRLREAVIARLPEGPPLYPPDYLTDQPARFLAAELIREKILHLTRQEVPHACAVWVDNWEEKGRLLRISATILVERDGQKGIIIGQKGQMLKKIGTLAREEMEGFFGRKVYLELYVKVRPDWRENPEFLREIDWRTMSGIDTSGDSV